MKMKRFFAFFMTVVLVVAMSVPAFAALGGFISSPSGVPAPQVSDFKPVTPDCTGKIVVTSWADRHTLDDATRARFEKAYNDIINLNSDANNELLAVMKDFEKSHGLDHKDLAVGSLFDISSYNCTHHEKHEGFIITIGVGDLEHFVGILHFTGSVWEELEINDVDEAAHTVTFTTPSLSPFAVVVNNGAEAPAASGNAWIWIVVAAVVVAAAAAAVVVVAKKKRA